MRSQADIPFSTVAIVSAVVIKVRDQVDYAKSSKSGITHSSGGSMSAGDDLCWRTAFMAHLCY